MTLKAGIDLIKKFEGCRLKSYPDPATGGLPITIGWGSTKDTHGKPFGLGATITQEQADTLLEYTIEHEYLPALSKIPHWNEMNENQKGALLSFAYNLGANFYGSSNFNTITKVLKNKEWSKVPDALYLYRNPGSNVEAGLARRRKSEGDLWKK
jgi:lysozyme